MKRYKNIALMDKQDLILGKDNQADLQNSRLTYVFCVNIML